MSQSLFYSLEHCILTLNGHQVVGWADEADALSFEPHETSSVVVGPDGLMIVSNLGHRGGQLTVKTLANSPSTKFFGQQQSVIRTGGVVVWSGTLTNTISGINLALEDGALINTPISISFGNEIPPSIENVFAFETVEMSWDGLQSRPRPLEPSGRVVGAIGGGGGGGQ